MQTLFVVLKKFNTMEQAQELGVFLEENGISYIIIDNSPYEAFSNNPLSKEYLLKIEQTDFAKAQELIANSYKNLIEEVDKDYYLFSFSTQELKEIITKPDEWGEFDYVLAQKILSDRNEEVTPEQLDKLKQERLEELAKPEKPLKSKFIRPANIFLGMILAQHKKVLPNGEEVYVYDRRTRIKGFIMLTIGIIFLVLYLVKVAIDAVNQMNYR